MNKEILANLNCERNPSYDMSKNVDILVMKFRDYNNLTDDEARFLLDKAKDAYYNTGKEIFNDNEYDTLEKSLGQENKSYVGSKHSDNYTVKHPFMMGSLSKVQIHEKTDGSIEIFDIEKEIDEHLGIEFSEAVFDGVKCCINKCICVCIITKINDRFWCI